MSDLRYSFSIQILNFLRPLLYVAPSPPSSRITSFHPFLMPPPPTYVMSVTAVKCIFPSGLHKKHFISCQILFLMSSCSPDVYIIVYCTSMSFQLQNSVLRMKKLDENISNAPESASLTPMFSKSVVWAAFSVTAAMNHQAHVLLEWRQCWLLLWRTRKSSDA